MIARGGGDLGPTSLKGAGLNATDTDKFWAVVPSMAFHRAKVTKEANTKSTVSPE